MQCEYCTKWFKSRAAMDMHIWTKAGEGSHPELKEEEKVTYGSTNSCPHCSRWFESGVQLDCHLWSKSGEDGHPEYLVTKVEGVFSCAICSRTLKSAESLEAHMWSLSGQSGHPVRDAVASESTTGSKNKCPHCPRWFKSEYGLDSHLYAFSTIGEHPVYVLTGEWAVPPPRANLTSFVEKALDLHKRSVADGRF